jgi:hypothetical protein
MRHITGGGKGGARRLDRGARAETRLRRSEERFRALIEKSEDLVAILDADGFFRYASPSYRAVLGWSPAELEGTDAFLLIHPEDHDAVRRTWDAGIVRPGATMIAREFRVRHKDGSWRIIDSVATNRLDEPALRGAVVNSRDVTARAEARAALREKQRELEALVWALAHDLKTPLTTITITADLLRERAARALTDEDRDDLDRIRRLSAHTEDMMRALLDFFRVTQGGEEPGPVDVGALVVQALDALRPQIDARRARVEVAALPVAWGRPRQLGRVLANLLGNAVRYVRAGEGVVRVTGGDDGAWTTIAVEDNGIGIPAGFHGVVFELFGRVTPEQHRVDGRVVDGTGVGLALVRRVVEAHGGTVAIDSAPGRGSRFTVRLPRPAAPADDARRVEEAGR